MIDRHAACNDRLCVPHGSGKQFARGQAGITFHVDDHPAPLGSGRQFARGQATPEGFGLQLATYSGRQFARGQAETLAAGDGHHRVRRGSGKQFARGLSLAVSQPDHE